MGIGAVLAVPVELEHPLLPRLPTMHATRQRTALHLLFFLACPACGHEWGPADSGPGDAGPADSNPPGENPDDQPITERPSPGVYRCRIERDRTDHAPRSWQFVPPAPVTTSNGITYLPRLESTPMNPFMQAPVQLLVSSFDAAGNFGPTTTLPAAMPDRVNGLAAAPRGDGFAVVWVENERLRFAAFDADGQTVVGGKDVLTGPAELSRPRLAAGADGGFGLVYTAAGTDDTPEVRFAVLDGAGGIRQAPRPLTAGAGLRFVEPGASVAAIAGGYAMTWRDPGTSNGGIDFATADLAGAEVLGRRRISVTSDPDIEVGGPQGFASSGTALVATAGGYVAAWTEQRKGQTIGAYSIVRLVRLDRAGVRQGAAVPLRRPTPEVDEVEPTLVPFGDAVAVLWGRGSHIYFCAGCAPDDGIDLLLVDPATLAPLSNVVSITNGGGRDAGGLMRHRVAVQGHTLLVTYLLTFHAHATAGSATFSCTR
jgi:hypothetical protein